MPKSNRIAERVGDKAVAGGMSITISPDALFAYSIIEKIMYVAEGSTLIAYHSGKETARYEYKSSIIARLYPTNGYVKVVYCHIDDNLNKEWFQGKCTPSCYPDELIALHRTDVNDHIIDFVDKEPEYEEEETAEKPEGEETEENSSESESETAENDNSDTDEEDEEYPE